MNIGAYSPGANPLNDLSVRMNLKIIEFLQQRTDAPTTFAQAKLQLLDLYNQIEKEARLVEQNRPTQQQTAQQKKK